MTTTDRRASLIVAGEVQGPRENEKKWFVLWFVIL